MKPMWRAIVLSIGSTWYFYIGNPDHPAMSSGPYEDAESAARAARFWATGEIEIVSSKGRETRKLHEHY